LGFRDRGGIRNFLEVFNLRDIIVHKIDRDSYGCSITGGSMGATVHSRASETSIAEEVGMEEDT
jgi:hypothetical protein